MTGEHKVAFNSEMVWKQVVVFTSRVGVLFFTGRLPLIFRDIATAIDARFGTAAIDKIFYVGQGL